MKVEMLLPVLLDPGLWRCLSESSLVTFDSRSLTRSVITLDLVLASLS